MARTMIDANKHLFQRLGNFCNSRGVEIAPIDGYRYVEGDTTNDLIIQGLKVASVSQFGPQRAAIHASLQEEDYIVLVGFDYIDNYVNHFPEFGEDVQEIPCLPGHVVVVLSEFDIRPKKSALEIRAYVEVADSKTDKYSGHDVEELRRLFPRISIFKWRSSPDESSFLQLVTKFAAAESAYGGGWIDEILLGDLLALASISAKSFPYEALSRAVFDTDPRNLYLALYRCLEATYAYKTSEELARALNLTITWSDLAVKLDKKLKWRPREASSLEAVLRYASSTDLRKMAVSLGSEGGSDLAHSAASLIYDLRNRIVHFGASLDSVNITGYDWNAICSALVALVYDIFNRAFDPVTV